MQNLQETVPDTLDRDDASDLIDLGRVSEETKGTIFGGYDGGVGFKP
jgi:hypothetical protein